MRKRNGSIYLLQCSIFSCRFCKIFPFLFFALYLSALQKKTHLVALGRDRVSNLQNKPETNFLWGMAGETLLKTWYRHSFKVCIQNIHTKAGEDYSANEESQVGHLSSRQQQSIKPRIRLFLHFLNWVMPLAHVPPLVVPFSKLEGTSTEIPSCILSSQPTTVLLLPCLKLCMYRGAASRLCCYQQCCLKGCLIPPRWISNSTSRM